MAYPPDDEKVTLGRIHQMKRNWYLAGQRFCAEERGDSRRDAAALRELATVCAKGVAASEGYLGAPEVLRNEDWDFHYRRDRSMEKALVALAKRAFGARQEAEGLACFKDAYIRHLNQGRSWRSIEKAFTVQGLPVVSHQVPLNASFARDHRFGAYGETGLCSNTPRLSLEGRKGVENTRITNGWWTRLVVGNPALELFAAFRSGSLAGKIIGKSVERFNRANVEELLAAVAEAERRRLAEQTSWDTSQSGPQLDPWAPPIPRRWQAKVDAGLRLANEQSGAGPIRVVSINLQTESLIAQEKRMIRDQALAFELVQKERGGLSGSPGPERPSDGEPSGDEDAIDGRGALPEEDLQLSVGGRAFRVLSFNCEVNNLGGGHLAKRNSRRLWGELFGLARAYEERGLPMTPPRLRDFGRKAIRALVEKLEATDVSELTRPANDYKTASRLAVLAYLSGCHVHFNCKSGKDRTGLMDVECKRLVLSLCRSYVRSGEVVVPRYALVDEPEREIYRTVLARAGNFEVQELNTGGRGFKVAQMPVLSATDRALKERFGGDEGMQFVYGLKSYMDIDPLK